jgi:hypothetical protein
LEVGIEQYFPLVVNKGNGPDSHSLQCIHSLQVALCLVMEEWPRVGNGPGLAIRDIHSLGKIHSLQVTLCLVLEEWPRVGNGLGLEIRIVILSCLRRIVQTSSSLMYYLLRVDSLSISHRCEWKNGPDDSIYIITLVLCRLMSDDCYEDCMTVDVYYCGGCVPLFVTIRY